MRTGASCWPQTPSTLFKIAILLLGWQYDSTSGGRPHSQHEWPERAVYVFLLIRSESKSIHAFVEYHHKNRAETNVMDQPEVDYALA